MRRSWQLTKGSFWRVVGILLIAALITSALTGIVSSILGAAGGLVAAQENADAYAAIMAGANFLNSVLQAAILPFSAAVTALTYIDLRMRKEGLDVELRQAAGV
jgi:possible integral membrane protein